MPEVVVAIVRSGRITALSQEDGGVRGGRHRGCGEEFGGTNNGPTTGKAATAPHQHALSTRAGCECIAHAIQAFCELHLKATVTSVNGVGAHDSISRRTMLED